MTSKRKHAQEKTSPDVKELRIQLAEAQETLRAIREGEVDAVIVSGSRGEQVFSLVGAESIYRLIVETMKEAAFTVALDGRILFCNARFGEFVKWPMEQILGHSLREFVDPANRSAVDALVSSAQEQPVIQRLVFANAEGALVPAHISANILSQPEGLSICVVATDLTELENSTEMIHQLRRQQEALQAANEELAATEEEMKIQNEELLTSRAELNRSRIRYQDLFETAPDGYISTDAEGIIQEANQAAARMFGCASFDLKGNPFSALLPLSERENYLSLLAHMHVGEKRSRKWELELRPPQSRPFWAEVTAAASRNEEDNIIGLRWLIRDVTERKFSEEALLKSEERFRAFVTASSDAVYRMSADWSEMRQLRGREFISDTDSPNLVWLDKYIYPDDQPRVLEAIHKAIRTKSIFELEHRVRRLDGSLGWTFSRAVPLLDAGGEIVEWFGAASDVTKRKQAEAELRRAKDELEQRVQERTEELAMRANQLRSLVGELTLAEQRERKRLATVLHDHLQQLLVAAKFKVAFLNRGENESVKQAAKETAEMIDECITASRSLTAELSPYVLHESGLNAGLEWLAQWMADKQGFSVDLAMEAVGPLHETTKILLFESIRELLLNAIKHSQARSAKVNLEIADGFLRAIVEDEGVGFDPGTSQLQTVGGFGLFSIRERLELMGGQFELESVPGKGSRFVLTVPITQSAPPNPVSS